MVQEDIVVSIVTVTYNASDFLEETIKSIISQTYPSIEYIIIDGGSTDNTLDIIHSYEKYISKWISEPDQGIYDAMNKGISMASGSLIGIVNASDYLSVDAVRFVVDAFVKHHDVGIVHGDINMLNEDGTFFKRKHPNPDLSQHYKGMQIHHPTVFVRKQVYDEVGTFDLQFKISADFDLILRCVNAGVKFHYIPEVISNFRLGGVSTQRQKLAHEDCANSLLKNGYSIEEVAAIKNQWRNKASKDSFYRLCYDMLRKFFPSNLMNLLAAKIGNN